MRKICGYNPDLDIVFLLVYLGLCAWALTRVDQDVRDAVDARRKRGDIIPDYDEKVRKYKKLAVLSLAMCMIAGLAGIMFCASKLL